MLFRKILLKIAPFLREVKAQVLTILGKRQMARNNSRPASNKGRFVLLSLGGNRGSSFVASAVKSLGFDLHIVSPVYPSRESFYARSWIKHPLFNDYEVLRALVAAIDPLAILVEQKNILLPIKARLNADLNLVDYGDQSHRTSNSKIKLREAIDAAKAPNIPWCLLENYKPEQFPYPFVLKPETGTGSRGITVVHQASDMEMALAKLASLEQDETVGGGIMLEAVIEGRQFDVEGVYKDGNCYPLSLTEEKYDLINNALPSAWYLFSPPVDDELREGLLAKAAEFTKALGVRNGAFHCEMRVNSNGDIYAIDYSNRMGYPILVSECCGYSFPEAYVRVMAGEEPDFSDLQLGSVFQRFVRNKRELSNFRKLMRDHPEHVVQKNMLGSIVGGVRTYARIALRARSFQELRDLLAQYDLVPSEWSEYYSENSSD